MIYRYLEAYCTYSVHCTHTLEIGGSSQSLVTMLKNLSYDSIAELYVTKFSTISLYLTKLYNTYSRAFHHRHQSHAAKSAKTFITVFRWFWCGSDMVPYCSDMVPPWFSNDANPLIWLDPTFVKETKWCFRSSLLRARALSLGWEHAVHIRAARLHGGLLSHRQATIHLDTWQLVFL